MRLMVVLKDDMNSASMRVLMDVMMISLMIVLVIVLKDVLDFQYMIVVRIGYSYYV
jgi:hypothetical protein